MTPTRARILTGLTLLAALSLVATACAPAGPEPDPKSRVAMSATERADLTTGDSAVEPVWTAEVDAFGWVLVVGEHVLTYVLEADGALSLVALAAADGAEEWRIPAAVPTPRAEQEAVGPHSDGEVVMLFQDRAATREVVIVDVDTGEERARREIDRPLAPAMCDLERLCLVRTSEEVGEATAFSVDPATAELRPTLAPYRDRADGHFIGSGVFLLNQQNALLVGLNSKTGEREWGRRVDSFVGTGDDAWPISGWDVGDRLLLEWSNGIWPLNLSVVGTEGSGVTALDRENGTELWRRTGVLRCGEFICSGDVRLVQEGDSSRYDRQTGVVTLEWVDATGTTVWSDEVDYAWLGKNAEDLRFGAARHLHPFSDAGQPMVFDEVAGAARAITESDTLACFDTPDEDRPVGDRYRVAPCTIAGAASTLTRTLVEQYAYADHRVADDAPGRHRVIRLEAGLALYDLP